MAADKLVDSTKLDNALTATANAIRAKGAAGQQSFDLSGETGFADAIESIPSAAAKNVQAARTVSKQTNTTSYVPVNTITVAKTGTYRITWVHWAYAAGSSSTYASQCYKNGSAIGSAQSAPAYNGTSFTASVSNVSLAKGDTLTLRVRTRSGSSYWTAAGMLTIEEQ